jgi:hypothetical protein
MIGLKVEKQIKKFAKVIFGNDKAANIGMHNEMAYAVAI